MLTAGADFNLDGHSVRRLFGFPSNPSDGSEILFEDTVNKEGWINNQRITEASGCKNISKRNKQ